MVHLQKVGGISGSERYLLGLLPQLRRAGWDARMIVLHDGGAQTFVDELRAGEVPVALVPLRSDVDPVAFARLVSAFKRMRPTIVQTHLVHADFYGLCAAALARVPVRVSTKHGFDDFRHRSLFAAADRLAARLAHRHVVVSAGLARYLSEVEGFRISTFDVIHYGIEASDEARTYDGRETRLVCIGRLIPIKGHAVLLRAFAEARRAMPGLTLEFVGTGISEDALQAEAASLELDGSVRFVGRVADVSGVLERASIVVVPSLGEGFGRIALEAMERARPVIASRVGGLAELVEHGVTGLLVPPSEPDALAGAIVRLATDAELARAMGAAGRRRAVEKFAEQRCVERTEELYRQELARAGLSRS